MAKKDCLNCKYYDEFKKFTTAIDTSLNKIAKGHAKNELDSLLSLNFQSFDKSFYNRA